MIMSSDSICWAVLTIFFFFLFLMQLLEPQKQHQVIQLLLLEDSFSPPKHSSIDYFMLLQENRTSAPVTPLFCEKGRVRKQQLPSHREQGCSCCAGEDSPSSQTLSALSTSSAKQLGHLKVFEPSGTELPASGNRVYQQSGCVWSQRHLKKLQCSNQHWLSETVYALDLKQAVKLWFIFFLRAQWHLVVPHGVGDKDKNYIKNSFISFSLSFSFPFSSPSPPFPLSFFLFFFLFSFLFSFFLFHNLFLRTTLAIEWSLEWIYHVLKFHH